MEEVILDWIRELFSVADVLWLIFGFATFVLVTYVILRILRDTYGD